MGMETESREDFDTLAIDQNNNISFSPGECVSIFTGYWSDLYNYSCHPPPIHAPCHGSGTIVEKRVERDQKGSG